MKPDRISFSKSTALGLGLALLAGCGGGSGTEPDLVDPVLDLSPLSSDTVFSLGDTVRLNVLARDDRGRDVARSAVSFSSSDSDVASVTGEGEVVSRSNGTATIRARWNALSDSIEVRVRQRLFQVAIDPGSPRVGIGATVTLQARGVDARGATVSGLPAASFTSSNSGVASVDPATGVVTASALGNATITASLVSPLDGTKNGTATLTVATVRQAATVEMGAETFIPGIVDISRGGTVTFVNESGVLHDVAFNVAALNIGPHAAGRNTRTFGTSGVFPYHCNLHGGMTGTVYVH